MEDKLLNVQQVAELLHVDPSWVYSQTRLKKIPFIKLGKYCRFSLADVQAWLADVQGWLDSQRTAE